MSDIYRTQQLVNAGFDFSQVFPEKQDYIMDKYKYDFKLPEIVTFMQQQTSDFTVENPVAQDLDEVIVRTITKWSEQTGSPNPLTGDVEIIPEGEPVQPVTVPVEEPAGATSDVDEWKEAVEGLKMLIEMGGEEAEINEWTDAHEGLIMLLEMEGVDVAAFKVEMAEGGSTYAGGGDISKGYYVEWKEGDQKVVEKYGSDELDMAKDLYRQQKEYGYPAVITNVADGTVVMGKEFKDGGNTEDASTLNTSGEETFISWHSNKSEAQNKMRALKKENPNQAYHIVTVGRGDHEIHRK